MYDRLERTSVRGVVRCGLVAMSRCQCYSSDAEIVSGDLFRRIEVQGIVFVWDGADFGEPELWPPVVDLN